MNKSLLLPDLICRLPDENFSDPNNCEELHKDWEEMAKKSDAFFQLSHSVELAFSRIIERYADESDSK